MSANKKKHYVPHKKIKIDDFNLDTADLTNVEGVTFNGESLADWIKKKSEERRNKEAKIGHTITVTEQKKFLKRTRQNRKQRTKTHTEFPGFVRQYSDKEIMRENAERRFMKTHGKYLFKNTKGSIDLTASILNLMMIWESKDVASVFKKLFKPIVEGKPPERFKETPEMTTTNINIFLCSKLPGKLIPAKLTKSSGPKISSIYKALSVGIKGKHQEGLITRKSSDEKGLAKAYELNNDIHKFPLEVLIAEVTRVLNEEVRQRAAANRKKKQEEADAAAKKAAAAEKLANEKTANEIDMETEEGLKTFIATHPSIAITDEEAKQLAVTQYSLVQAIMHAGYLKGAEDEREKIELIAAKPSVEPNDFEIEDADELDPGAPIVGVTEETTAINELVFMATKLPRGTKIVRKPDGTTEIMT